MLDIPLMTLNDEHVMLQFDFGIRRCSNGDTSSTVAPAIAARDDLRGRLEPDSAVFG